jgi:hypothetical protein
MILTELTEFLKTMSGISFEEKQGTIFGFDASTLRAKGCQRRRDRAMPRVS